MEFEEGERRKRAAWAEVDLPRFVVVGWSPESVGGHGTSICMGGRRVATSDGWAYRSQLGQLLEVEVVRPDAAPIAEEQQRTVSNLMYAYARTVHGGDIETYGPEVERLEEAVRSGTLPWETAPIVVDHVQTSSESLNLGSNFWIAVAQLAGIPGTAAGSIRIRGY